MDVTIPCSIYYLLPFGNFFLIRPAMKGFRFVVLVQFAGQKRDGERMGVQWECGEQLEDQMECGEMMISQMECGERLEVQKECGERLEGQKECGERLASQPQ